MDTLNYLRANECKGKGKFVSEASFLRDNWEWLKYSYAIAVKVRRRMSELGITQKQMAEKMDCTQQNISVLLKGKVNMTLETIARLENALQMHIMGEELIPREIESKGYLNSPRSPEDTVHSGTSQYVEGYRPRKKKGPKK